MNNSKLLNPTPQTLSEARAQHRPPADSIGQASGGHTKDGLRFLFFFFFFLGGGLLVLGFRV